MENLDEKISNEERAELKSQVKKILEEQLQDNSVRYDSVYIKIFKSKSVGVQGDQRTYARPAGISIFQDGELYWDPTFLSEFSNRVTNEVKGINRVTYIFEYKKHPSPLTKFFINFFLKCGPYFKTEKN